MAIISHPSAKRSILMSYSPYQSPVEPTQTDQQSQIQFVFDAFAPLYQRRGWMKLIGIVLMVLGAIYCITIIGVIVGLPFILMGLFMFQSAGHLDNAYAGQIGLFRESMAKLSQAVLIMGILVLIWLILMVIYFGFIILALLLGGIANV